MLASDLFKTLEGVALIMYIAYTCGKSACPSGANKKIKC